jgi:hypothetical protein
MIRMRLNVVFSFTAEKERLSAAVETSVNIKT